MDNPYNSDSLADELDKFIPSGSRDAVTPPDDTDLLMNTAMRLANTPIRGLSPEAMARIEAKMAQSQPLPTASPIRYRLAALGAAAAIVLFAGIAAILIRNQNPIDSIMLNITSTLTVEPSATNSPQITFTATVTETEAQPEQTSTLTSVPSLSPTDTPVALMPTVPAITNTLTVTERPVVTSTSLPPTMPITTLGSTPPQAVAIILEGPIETIEDNQLVIYGIRVELESDNPLLKVLRVDDYVRIEGEVAENTDTIVIVAQTLVFENPQPQDNEVYINPEGNDAWRDPGDCTNPPPVWARANQWRARCENPQPPANTGGQNNNNSGGNNSGNDGMGDDDDDNDDDGGGDDD